MSRRRIIEIILILLAIAVLAMLFRDRTRVWPYLLARPSASSP